jgi:hypothetical protein
MPYGLRLAVLGLLTFAAGFAFASRGATDASPRGHAKAPQRISIYPNGGSDGPPSGGSGS